MDWLNILILVIAVAFFAVIVYIIYFNIKARVRVKPLPDEKIIIRTSGVISYGGNAISAAVAKDSRVTTLYSIMEYITLTNKRIYSEDRLFKTKLLDILIQNILYFKFIKWPFVSFIWLGYQDDEEEKKVFITFWNKDAVKWNEELQKITAGKSYV
jgi:hypothetical protein